MAGPSLFRRRRSRIPGHIPAELMARSRERVDALAETLSPEAMTALLRELQRDAAPLIERATGRRRHRGPGRGLLVLVILGAAAAICYLLWQRRDEEPAYLLDDPERPSVTPAGSPRPSTPAPEEPSPATSEDESAAALRLARSMVERELAGTRASAPATPGPATAPREPRTREGAPALPSMLGGAPGMPWASGRPQLPDGSGPSLPQ